MAPKPELRGTFCESCAVSVDLVSVVPVVVLPITGTDITSVAFGAGAVAEPATWGAMTCGSRFQGGRGYALAPSATRLIN